MKNLTVTQKILSLGATYKVKDNNTENLLLTVKGKIITVTPKLNAYEGESDKIVATVKGNFFGTKFDIYDESETLAASIKFPFLSFLTKFTLTIGNSEYKASGGILARKFTCIDEAGTEILTVSKQIKLRDQFNVVANDSVDTIIAALSAITIDQRYFQKK